MADFTEKQLEDWMVANWHNGCSNMLFPYVANPERSIELVGRQVRCANGIIDLLAFVGRTFAIVELKATTVDERVIEQVIRYQRAIEDASIDTEFDISLSAGWGYPSGQATATFPVVIAPGFTARAIRTLSLIGQPVIASFDNGAFMFSTPQYERATTSNNLQSVIRPFVASAMGWELGHNANRVIQAAQSIKVYEN